MTRILNLATIVLAAVCGLSTTNIQAANIADHAQLFSPEAARSADAAIDRLEAKYHHGVRIETHESPPGDKAGNLDQMSPSDRDRFFANWLRERAKATRSEGLFILITKQPSHLHVGTSNSLKQAGFTQSQRQEVIGKMTTAFKAGEFDRGLTEGVAAIERAYGTLTKSAPISADRRSAPVAPAERAHSQGWSIWSLVLIGAAVVAGLLLLSMLTRSFSGSGPSAGGYGTPGGGSWLGSLMAGLGGAFMGNWLYDTFSGHHHTAHAEDAHQGGSAGIEDHHTDNEWASAGADWGDNSGGSDFDAGDAGGGDW